MRMFLSELLLDVVTADQSSMGCSGDDSDDGVMSVDRVYSLRC